MAKGHLKQPRRPAKGARGVFLQKKFEDFQRTCKTFKERKDATKEFRSSVRQAMCHFAAHPKDTRQVKVKSKVRQRWYVNSTSAPREFRLLPGTSAECKKAGEEWKKLSKTQKRPYRTKYKNEKKQHKKDMAAFVAAGGVPKVTKKKKRKAKSFISLPSFCQRRNRKTGKRATKDVFDSTSTSSDFTSTWSSSTWTSWTSWTTWTTSYTTDDDTEYNPWKRWSIRRRDCHSFVHARPNL